MQAWRIALRARTASRLGGQRLRSALAGRRTYSSGGGSSGGQGTNAGVLAGLAVASAGAGFVAAKAFGFTEQSEREASIVREWKDAKYGGKAEFDKAYAELLEILGEDNISTDLGEREFHAGNTWVDKATLLPIAVVFPRSTEEVSRVAKVCHKYRLPMIGYSGGSSLEGNFRPQYGGICVDFMNMSDILEVRPDDMDATVQPGVGWMDLNQHLEAQGHNLFFAVDPGPPAKIGGMVGTSCSGTNCVRYGPMRDHIVNMTVVLADGTIIKTRQRPRKSSAGYNLNHLFCGSEGTLGLVTEITVKLQPVPEETSVAVCSFPSVRDATSTAMDIIRAGVQVNAVEFMDDTQMKAIIDAGYTTKDWETKPALFLKFAGSKRSVEEQIARTRELSAKHGGSSFRFARSKEEQEELWSARKAVLWANLAVGPQGGQCYSTDVAVPISRLADVVNKTKEDIVQTGLWGATLGHVGDGNFHVGIVFEEKDIEEAKALARRIVYYGLDMEGTCTGEHGIGIGKRGYLIDEVGPDTVNLMRTIKLALDPLELMNPGKIFSREEMERRIKPA